jgi:hypothetical protein
MYEMMEDSRIPGDEKLFKRLVVLTLFLLATTF